MSYIISTCMFGKKTCHVVVGHQNGVGFVVVGQLGAVVVGQLSNVVSLDLHDVHVCKLHIHQ